MWVVEPEVEGDEEDDDEEVCLEESSDEGVVDEEVCLGVDVLDEGVFFGDAGEEPVDEPDEDEEDEDDDEEDAGAEAVAGAEDVPLPPAAAISGGPGAVGNVSPAVCW